MVSVTPAPRLPIVITFDDPRLVVGNVGFGGIWWQRRPSLQLAVERYHEESVEHGSASSTRCWFWCSRP